MFYNLLFRLHHGGSVAVPFQNIIKYDINNSFLVPPIATTLCDERSNSEGCN